MNKNSGIRLIFIFILVMIFFVPIYPTIKWYSLPKEKRDLAELKFENPEKYKSLRVEKQHEIDNLKALKNKTLNLGLDLQGGMHIVLEAEISKLKNRKEKMDAVKQSLEIIRNRVDQFGVSEPSIAQQGENRIVVELPGVKDPERAEKLLNIKGKLEFKLVDSELSKPENFTNYKEGILRSDVKLPEDEEILFLWSKNKDTGKIERQYPLVVKKTPTLTGALLKTAGVSMDQFNEAGVDFQLKSKGAEIFFKATSENVGKRLSIVLDNKIRSAPRIKEPLRDRGQITGNFTLQEAKDLALILRAGATPVKLKIIEKRIVGPSLGEDSIRSGLNAAVYGFILVVIFMLFYYKGSGIIANITLFLNLFFLVSILILLKFTLTLPGMAGIVLTIGMAVDANVLIFERIKEELRAGKSLRASVDAGFEKAFRTILDANVTTLITAFILSQFGTGPIKGFAVTLFIGITANLFTAVYVSHNIFNFLLHKYNIKKISI